MAMQLQPLKGKPELEVLYFRPVGAVEPCQSSTTSPNPLIAAVIYGDRRNIMIRQIDRPVGAVEPCQPTTICPIHLLPLSSMAMERTLSEGNPELEVS